MYQTFCSSILYHVRIGERCGLFAVGNIPLHTSDPGRAMLIYTAEELSHSVEIITAQIDRATEIPYLGRQPV